MRGFREVREIKERELRNLKEIEERENFKKIKPETNASIDEAKSFVNNLFGSVKES